jgi:peroxidase
MSVVLIIVATSSLLMSSNNPVVQGGCDASIMLAGANSEMNSNSNFGVRRLGIIDSVKSDLESMCPNTVSCADIIALAGREAVFFSNGPEMQIPLGRKDATSSSTAEADNKLPPAFVSVDNMLSIFGSFGMTTAESVAILGMTALRPLSH